MVCSVCKVGNIVMDVKTDFDGTFHRGWLESIPVESSTRDTDAIESCYCDDCGVMFNYQTVRYC